jgi:hypothetical protein
MPTIKYHKECNSPVEYDNNIYAACGDSECCGGYDEGYVCTKCRCIVHDEDIGEIQLDEICADSEIGKIEEVLSSQEYLTVEQVKIVRDLLANKHGIKLD